MTKEYEEFRKKQINQNKIFLDSIFKETIEHILFLKDIADHLKVKQTFAKTSVKKELLEKPIKYIRKLISRQVRTQTKTLNDILEHKKKLPTEINLKNYSVRDGVLYFYDEATQEHIKICHSDYLDDEDRRLWSLLLGNQTLSESIHDERFYHNSEKLPKKTESIEDLVEGGKEKRAQALKNLLAPAGLTNKQFRVFKLVRLDGKTTEEAGKIMGIGQKTAWRHLELAEKKILKVELPKKPDNEIQSSVWEQFFQGLEEGRGTRGGRAIVEDEENPEQEDASEKFDPPVEETGEDEES